MHRLNFNPIALVDDGSCIYDDLCDGLVDVLFVLDGGLMPDEVGLNVSNDCNLLMEMDGYTGSSQGCGGLHRGDVGQQWRWMERCRC